MPDTRRNLSTLQGLLGDNSSGDISAQDGRDVLVSEHPENVIQSVADASEPSSGQLAGDLFLPTNGFYLKRWNGSAWVPWGPLFPMTPPVSGDFAWVNQETASVVTTNGGIYLSDVSAGGAYDVRLRKKAAPSTPYTITAAMLLNSGGGGGASGYFFGGLAFRQSSDGKMVIVGVEGSPTDLHTIVGNFTDVNNNSSFALADANKHLKPFELIWMRIGDDGTNRKFWLSADGQNFIQVHSVGRTSFMTADEVGFYIAAYSNPIGLTLLSWKEA